MGPEGWFLNRRVGTRETAQHPVIVRMTIRIKNDLVQIIFISETLHIVLEPCYAQYNHLFNVRQCLSYPRLAWHSPCS